MKLRLLALAASAALTAASAASAAQPVTIATVSGVQITDALITDFNSNQAGQITDLAGGYSFTQGDAGAFTRDGGLGLASGVSAPPPADNGVAGAYYETVEGHSSATLTAAAGLSSFQFYMGSPDNYNGVTITFVDPNISPVTLSGTAIWGGAPQGNGDQSLGYTVTYSFAAPVKSIEFTSSQNSFEFDKLAGISAGVPEPASWALMILGFGGAGAALRGKRRQAVAAAA